MAGGRRDKAAQSGAPAHRSGTCFPAGARVPAHNNVNAFHPVAAPVIFSEGLMGWPDPSQEEPSKLTLHTRPTFVQCAVAAPVILLGGGQWGATKGPYPSQGGPSKLFLHIPLTSSPCELGVQRRPA